MGNIEKCQIYLTILPNFPLNFWNAYQTGLIIMPGEGFVDEAIALGNKGMINMPDRWEVPYYTGLVYHIYKKDYLSAAKLFEKAASYNDAPANAKYFAGIYYNKADQREHLTRCLKLSMIQQKTKV